MKKSTISIIILTIILVIAIGSGLWTFVLKDPVTELKDDLLNQNPALDTSPAEEKILNWILDQEKDSLEVAVTTLRKENPELSKKLKKYLKSLPNKKNKLFAQKEVIIQTVPSENPKENISTKESKSDKKDIEIYESKVEVTDSPLEDNKLAIKYLKFKVGNYGVYYTGEITDGKANGYGKGIFDNGLVYEGSWVNNRQEGKGTLKWPDGSFYEGAFVNNSRAGKGTHTWKNQEKYIGEWFNDNRHGEGILYDRKGKVKYKGEWKSDVFIP